jgi:hypothetical protein
MTWVGPAAPGIPSDPVSGEWEAISGAETEPGTEALEEGSTETLGEAAPEAC